MALETFSGTFLRWRHASLAFCSHPFSESTLASASTSIPTNASSLTSKSCPGRGRFLWPIAKAEARRADVRPREGPTEKISRCTAQVLCAATRALLASPHSRSSCGKFTPSAGVSVHRRTSAPTTCAVSAHNGVTSGPSATDEPSTCHSSGSDLPFDFLPHKATAPAELKFRN